MSSAKYETKGFAELVAAGLKLSHIPNNGACQFTALSDQLFGNHKSAQRIREKVVECMKRDSSTYRPFLSYNDAGGLRIRLSRRCSPPKTTHQYREPCPDGPWITYLSNMAKEDYYGDNLTLQAFANEYNVDIKVYAKGAPSRTITCIGKPDRKSIKLLHIAYHPEAEHYSSIRMKTNNSRPESAKIPTNREESSSSDSSTLSTLDTTPEISPKPEEKCEQKSTRRPRRPGFEWLGDESDSDSDDDMPVKKPVMPKTDLKQDDSTKPHTHQASTKASTTVIKKSTQITTTTTTNQTTTTTVIKNHHTITTTRTPGDSKKTTANSLSTTTKPKSTRFETVADLTDYDNLTLSQKRERSAAIAQQIAFKGKMRMEKRKRDDEGEERQRQRQREEVKRSRISGARWVGGRRQSLGFEGGEGKRG